MTNDGISVDEATNTLRISRTYRADSDQVWRAWTEPRAIEQWWGPHGWTTTVHQMDVWPEGHWRSTMAADDGSYDPIRMFATYQKVEPNQVLEFHDAFADENWDVDNDNQFPTTVTFASGNGTTQVHISATFPSNHDLQQAIELGMDQGYLESLVRLDAIVAE